MIGITWEEAETYTLFPVEVGPSIVLTYSVHKNGAGLSRESQDIIAPGDYGLYAIGKNAISCTTTGYVTLTQETPHFTFSSIQFTHLRASLTAPISQKALDRDRQCIFSGVVPNCGSDALVATWVFPHSWAIRQLSDDPWLESKSYQNPNACDLSDLMVVENVVSGRKDIITLFWENKLGVDVEVRRLSHHRIRGVGKLKQWCIIDGPYRPSDRFLRLHFQECLAVSVCRGDVMEDYHEQEIENFMEELGVYDGEIDTGDP
ncbi:hypothetical protein BU17DRAFT_85143 [Hysterangium stoloniferum]|nr:hypothetical protein BU17DRAFT_85143 [Hysterangium stoloniferum]